MPQPLSYDMLDALSQHVGRQGERRKWEVIKDRRGLFIDKYGREPTGAELGYPDEDMAALDVGNPATGQKSYSADEAEEMHAAAQARFAEVDEKSAAGGAQTAERLAMLKEAAAQDEWVRSVGYEPDQDLSDPEKGILVEEMPAEKLLRLRKGAAPRAEGYTGGTGGFVQAEMTPELADRLAANEDWRRQQPERDLEYAMTPEQKRRDPEYAADAAARLPAMQQQRRLASRQANTDKMIDAITGTSGLIDPNDVEKLQLLDPTISIPTSRIGISREQAIASMQNEINYIYEIASKLAATGIIEGDRRLEAANKVAAEARKTLMLLSNPKSDPNAVTAEYQMAVARIRTELMPQGEAPAGGHKWEEVE